jgi:hypothetical protein
VKRIGIFALIVLSGAAACRAPQESPPAPPHPPLEGRIVWDGVIPASQIMLLSDERLARIFGRVSVDYVEARVHPQDRGLRDAIVWLLPAQGLPSGFEPKPAQAEAIEIQFGSDGSVRPPAAVGSARGTVVLSSDTNGPIVVTEEIHDPHSGTWMYVTSESLPRIDPPKLTLPRRFGLVRFRAREAPWMEAHVLVPALPHAAVTDEHGRFRFDGVGPGEWKLRLFHPATGLQERTITVPAGASRPPVEVHVSPLGH